jgi:sodium/hydrogen exchanger 8
MKKREFFSNFSTICMFAIVGTLIATFITSGLIYAGSKAGWYSQLSALECLLFGSLISAVDPVATLSVFKKAKAPNSLFNLVFGESVLNDAVAIVLFGIFETKIKNGSDLDSGTIFVACFELIGIMIGSGVVAVVFCFSSAWILRSMKGLRGLSPYS